MQHTCASHTHFSSWQKIYIKRFLVSKSDRVFFLLGNNAPNNPYCPNWNTKLDSLRTAMVLFFCNCKTIVSAA